MKPMKNTIRLLAACIVIVALVGCGAATIKPNYTSSNTDLLRIGGEKPEDKSPETINMGSYCLQVADQWKEAGKTPDNQIIWSKDTFRKVVPCQ